VLIPRSEARPFRGEVRAAIGDVLGPAALAITAVMACATELLASFEGSSWAFAQVLTLAWALLCCRRAAHGHPPFSVPGYSDLGAAATSLLPRLALSAGFLPLGAALLVDWGHRATPSLPAAAALGLLAVWLFPPAMAAASLEGAAARWSLPWSIPGFSSRLAPHLGSLRLAASGVVLAAIASSTIEPFDVRGGDPNLGTHIVHATLLRAAGIVALLLLATLAGRLVFTYAEEFGHGDPDSHRVPVAPDAVPRGRRGSLRSATPS
jgi:hypothetical protein